MAFKEDWVKQLSDESKEVLKTKSVPTGVGDSYQVEELQKNAVSMTKIGRETYYRYHVNWLSLIVSLLVTSIALGITVLKIGRAIFDLAFHQIFGMFIAASDLTGGQRTKSIGGNGQYFCSDLYYDRPSPTIRFVCKLGKRIKDGYWDVWCGDTHDCWGLGID